MKDGKKILQDIPKNSLLPYTNVCDFPLTAPQFKTHKYIPILHIIDNNHDILPPSQLKERFPTMNWKNISLNILNFITKDIRNQCKRLSHFPGNYEPLAHPLFLITNPSKKGCKELAKLIEVNQFQQKHWKIFEKFSSEYSLPPPGAKGTNNQVSKNLQTY